MCGLLLLLWWNCPMAHLKYQIRSSHSYTVLYFWHHKMQLSPIENVRQKKAITYYSPRRMWEDGHTHAKTIEEISRHSTDIYDLRPYSRYTPDRSRLWTRSLRCHKFLAQHEEIFSSLSLFAHWTLFTRVNKASLHAKPGPHMEEGSRRFSKSAIGHRDPQWDDKQKECQAGRHVSNTISHRSKMVNTFSVSQDMQDTEGDIAMWLVVEPFFFVVISDPF